MKEARGEQLLQDLLAVAANVPPSRFADLPAFRAILAASGAARGEVVEAVVARKASGDTTFAGLGKYFPLGLNQLLVALLRDESLELPRGYAARLWGAFASLPRVSALETLERLVARDGWSVDVAEGVSDLADEIADAADVLEGVGADSSDLDDEELELDEDEQDELEFAQELMGEHPALFVAETNARSEQVGPLGCHPRLSALAAAARKHLEDHAEA